jgi:hypothetical protein
LQHQTIAAQDRNSLALVNHGVPANPAVVQPLSAENRPAGFAPVQRRDYAAAQQRYAAPPSAPQAQYAAPNTYGAPTQHASSGQYVAPASHTASAYRATAYGTPAATHAHAHPSYHTPEPQWSTR